MTWAYYNEIEPAAAHVLRALIARNIIAPGEVDERSIVDVRPDDLRGFTQCHFFAGGGLWSIAARLAGWPDDRPLWTGSCPCQPFSVAGKGLGTTDDRHLWPHFHRLIAACRPEVCVGEQVSGKAGYDWLDGVRSDLEGEDYTCEAFDLPACAVDAPHIRQRLYWVANASDDGAGRLARSSANFGRRGVDAGAKGLRRDDRACLPSWADARGSGDMGHAESLGRRGRQDDEDGRGRERAPADTGAGGAFGLEYAARERRGEGWAEHDVRGGRSTVAGTSGHDGVADAASGHARAEWQQRSGLDGFQPQGGCDRGPARDAERASFWRDAELRLGADGKARRVGAGIRLLVDGLPGRVAQLRIGGNAIVAPLASEVLKALMETMDA